jgi:hypothetical protein
VPGFGQRDPHRRSPPSVQRIRVQRISDGDRSPSCDV